MRAFCLLLGAIALAGCVGGVQPCTAQADCPGGRCDTLVGVCVIVGAGGGGGTGVGGGGSAGGVGGGGGSTDAGQCWLGPCSIATLCVDSAGGHSCQPRFTALVWKVPLSGAMIGKTKSIFPEVELVADARSDGGGYPPSVEAHLPGMGRLAFSRVLQTSRYTGASLMGNMLTEGNIALFVSYDGGSYGLDAGVSVVVDKTDPIPTIRVQPEPARPAGGGWGAGGWRRDERPHVLVEVTNDDISAATLTMAQTAIAEAPALADCTATMACALPSRCRCFRLDLSSAPLPMLTANFPLAATVKDSADNQAMVTGAVGVTRLRWTRAVSMAALRSAPAVSKDGYVLVGTAEGLTGGNLLALNPDGTTKWTLPRGPVEAGVSIANIGNKEYVAYATTNGVFEAVNVLNETDKLGSDCNSGDPLTSYNGGIAVGKFNAVTTFVGMRNSSNGLVTRLQMLRAASCGGSDAPMMASSDAFNLLWPAAPVVSNNIIILPGKSGHIRAYDAFALPSDLAMIALSGYPVDLNASLPGFNGLALRSNGSKVVGGGAGVGRLFQHSVSNPTATEWRIPTVAGIVGAPTIRGGHAFFGYDLSLRHVELPSSGTPIVAVQSLATSGEVQTFPVAGDTELYSLSTDGTLYVSSFTPLVESWKNGFVAPNSLASPALDCSRPDKGGAGNSGRPGTLYLPLGNGTLVSVIVDSRRLDLTAEWPKYQRDAYNSGNANSVNELLNPGCP